MEDCYLTHNASSTVSGFPLLGAISAVLSYWPCLFRELLLPADLLPVYPTVLSTGFGSFDSTGCHHHIRCIHCERSVYDTNWQLHALYPRWLSTMDYREWAYTALRSKHKFGGPYSCSRVEGAGIGLTLQPTLVGMYANSRTEDRAVTTGLRNFIRTIGGAFGLVVSGVILSNTLQEGLYGKSYVSASLLKTLTSSTYALDNLDISQDQQDQVLNVYMQGLHYIFVFFTVCSGLSLLLTFWVGNTNLKIQKPPEDEETGTVISADAEPQPEQETKQGAKTDSKPVAGESTSSEKD